MDWWRRLISESLKIPIFFLYKTKTQPKMEDVIDDVVFLHVSKVSRQDVVIEEDVDLQRALAESLQPTRNPQFTFFGGFPQDGTRKRVRDEEPGRVHPESSSSSESSSKSACILCFDSFQAIAFACTDGHNYCIDCADAFAQNALGKPAAVLAQAQGIPCGYCASSVPLDKLSVGILARMASVLSFALCPRIDERPSSRILNALNLYCPYCNGPAEVDMENCKTQTCPRCEKSFCGCCFQPECADYHSNRVNLYDKMYDLPARRREHGKVIHAQLLAVFRDLSIEERESALATLSPHLSVARLHAITQAVRLL